MKKYKVILLIFGIMIVTLGLCFLFIKPRVFNFKNINEYVYFENHIDEIKGVYVPFWLFDAEVQGNVQYQATRVRRWSDSQYRYTETSYYSVVRAGGIGFENVPVDGSTKMDDTLMESIEPYNFADAVDFQTAYLSGYLAEKYDVDAETSIARANERIKKSTEEAFRETVQGYDSVMLENSGINLQNGTAKYALCPVWLLNTQWNGQKFTFAINGQTGKICGQLPVSKGRAWAFFAKLAIPLSILAVILAHIVVG